MNYDTALQNFASHLRDNEKSSATIEKYTRAVRAFLIWLDGRDLTKERTVAYKEALAADYAAAGVNAMLAGINSYLDFIDRADCRVKPLRIQRNLFADESRELTKAEYIRLLRAAGETQTYYVMQTICSTGIRVSELRHITVEAVQAGRVSVRNKGKTRIIFLPAPLCKLLRRYIQKAGITTGSIFLTRNKKPLDRSTIWRRMKALCRQAQVEASKVYPHALRRLFARIFYSVEKDLLRLADLLGHASINTTRIYTRETGAQHMRLLDRVGKILLTE